MSHPSAGGFSTGCVNLTHCVFGELPFASMTPWISNEMRACAETVRQRRSLWPDTTRPYPMGQECGLSGQSSSRITKP